MGKWLSLLLSAKFYAGDFDRRRPFHDPTDRTARILSGQNSTCLILDSLDLTEDVTYQQNRPRPFMTEAAYKHVGSKKKISACWFCAGIDPGSTEGGVGDKEML